MRAQQKALLQSMALLFLLIGACVLTLMWAAKAENSQVAKTIREAIGIAPPAKKVTEPIAPPPAPVVVIEPEPEPIVVMPPEPQPIPEITFSHIARIKHLWPKTLELKSSKQISIRYNGNSYGFMEFTANTQIKVLSLKAPDEIDGIVNGNYLNLSVHETNFEEWFRENYAENYYLQPIPQESTSSHSEFKRPGTKEGDARFWTDMLIWCHQNYESIALEIGEHNLVFKWLPKEEAPIDFGLEAREIARSYLLKRAEWGGTENYAPCEIRHPSTNELLGSGAMFIPRL